MPATQDNSERIAVIEAALDSGVTSVRKDDHSVTQDLNFLEKRLSQLKLEDADSVAAGNVRPRCFRPNLGGAF